MIEGKSWLDTYLNYTANQESPEIFHRWVGLFCVCACLERNVWIGRGYYTLYPNQYIILVAASARCRKSVATSIGMDIVNSLPEPPDLFAQKITPEALIGRLSRKAKAHALIYAPEVSTFMGKDSYVNGLLPVLTELYDGSIGRAGRPWVYETRSHGEEKLHDACVNLLGASTKEWLRIPIPIEAVGGGFTSRVVFVFADRPRAPIAFPSMPASHTEMRRCLLNDLQEIRKLGGEYMLEDAAKVEHERWYKEHCTLIDSSWDPSMEGYYGRKHDHILKVCMSLAASRRDILLITKQDHDDATKMIEEVEQGLPAVIHAIGVTPGGADGQEVWDIIRRRTEILKSDLLRLLFHKMDAERVMRCIDTLSQARMIEAEIAPGLKGDVLYRRMVKR